MPRHTRTLAFTPGTADSPLRTAFHEGLNAMKYKAPDGLAMSEQEDDAREGRTHLARLLDVVVQRAFVSGVPAHGEHGVLQMFDRARFAVLAMYGLVPETIDPQTASEMESEPDATLDCIQAKRQDQMSRGERLRAAAIAEQQRDALDAYAIAQRAAVARLDEAQRTNRSRLAGSAA